MVQLVTNWMGDSGQIRKMRCGVTKFNYIGDTQWITGTVTGVRSDPCRWGRLPRSGSKDETSARKSRAGRSLTSCSRSTHRALRERCPRSRAPLDDRWRKDGAGRSPGSKEPTAGRPRCPLRVSQEGRCRCPGLVDEERSPVQAPYRLTMPAILRRAAALFGPQDYVVVPDRRITFSQVESEARVLAMRLLAMGVSKGTRVGIHLVSGPEWAVVFAAVTRIGAVAMPFSTLFRPAELRTAMRVGDVSILISSRDHPRQGSRGVPRGGRPRARRVAARPAASRRDPVPSHGHATRRERPLLGPDGASSVGRVRPASGPMTSCWRRSRPR